MSALRPRAGNVCPNIDLLRGFERREMDLILAAAKVRRFPAKSVMTYQGEPADHLLLLWKGRARYFFETPNGKKLIMIWITPGHSFGGAALSTRPSPYLLGTEAVRDSVVLAWDGATIRGLARRFPQLLENAIISALDYLFLVHCCPRRFVFADCAAEIGQCSSRICIQDGRKNFRWR